MENGEWKVESCASGKRKVESGKLDDIAFRTDNPRREKYVAFGTRFTPLRFRFGPPKVGLPFGMAPTGRKLGEPLVRVER